MSRSYRHAAVYAPSSNKEFKVSSHRCQRRVVRHKLHACVDFDSLTLPLIPELSNFYDSDKDGYYKFFGDNDPDLLKLLRK